MLMNQLGLARKILKEVWLVEAKTVDPQWKDVVGEGDNTTQSHELYQQEAGFAPAEQTLEGESVKFDSQFRLFQLKLTPVMFTKGTRKSKLMDFTNQYKEVTDVQKQWAKAFVHKKNQVVTNLLINGFTSTTYGVNSETLFATSHSMGGLTFSNRPSTELVYGPANHQRSLYELRRQTSARGTPQPYIGDVLYMGPPELEPSFTAVIRSMQIAQSNDNDTNEFIRNRSKFKINDYLSSTTAWFARAMDNSAHGLVFLQQMGYDIEKLARDTSLMDTWIGSESYQVGWKDAHGTWATTGAP